MHYEDLPTLQLLKTQTQHSPAHPTPPPPLPSTIHSTPLPPPNPHLQVYSREFRDASLEAAPTTPGMKYRHYSPAVPVVLVEPPTQQPGAGASRQSGWKGGDCEVSGSSKQQQQQPEEGEKQAGAEGQQQQQQQQECQQNGMQQRSSSPPGASQTAAAAAVAATAQAAVGELQRAGRRRVALLRTTLAVGTPPGWLPPAGGAPAATTNGSCTDNSVMQLVQPGGGDISADESPVAGDAGDASAVLQYCLGPMGCPGQVARVLFAGLRDAEAAGVDAIVVEGVGEGGEGLAVMNRLRKAASSVRHAAWPPVCSTSGR